MNPKTLNVLDEMQEAQSSIDSAASELSVIYGYSNQCEALRALYGDLKCCWHQVETRLLEIEREMKEVSR